MFPSLRRQSCHWRRCYDVESPHRRQSGFSTRLSPPETSGVWFPLYHVGNIASCSCGLLLFRCGGTVSKLQWWCRTTPRAHLSALLQDFHDRQKRTLETFLGSPLNNHQWTQAKLPTKLGGAGLVSTRTEIGLDVVSLADVGFLASHRRCGPSIHQLFSPQPAPNLHDCEGPAVRHLTACLPELGSILQDPIFKLITKPYCNVFTTKCIQG